MRSRRIRLEITKNTRRIIRNVVIGFPASLAVASLFATPDDGRAAELFRESFGSFTAPPANFNGRQFESGHPVAFGGDLSDWTKSGGGVVHAVNLADDPEPGPRDFAVMFWQDNVITLNESITGSNAQGQSYKLDFLASPAVYQAPSQVTTPDDGLLIEVLRADDSVLASYTHQPGAWAGDIAMVADSFTYQGDGSGDIRLRIGPSNFNSGHFGGALDAVTLKGAATLFSDGFDDFTAPVGNFNGLQFESGLEVAFGGSLPKWTQSGGGAVHAVNRIAPPPPPTPDYAVMIWQDNVIEMDSAIAGSNGAGQRYQVSFDASPAVYQAPSQTTSDEDGLLVEVLRADGSILATHEYLPGAWEGDIELASVLFEYTGDGSGDVRFRVGPSNFNSGRFGGAIDNLTLSSLAAMPGDYNGNGQLDATDIDRLTLAVRSGTFDAKYDLNADTKLTQDDRIVWVRDLAKTYVGDANLDRQFDSQDFVVVFQAGQYEDASVGNSTWSTGDWNGDLEFNSADFLIAFQEGGYGQGVRPAAVPEPIGMSWCAVAALVACRRWRRGR